MKPIDLSQIFLSIGAVIPDRGVDAVVAHGHGRYKLDHFLAALFLLEHV
jgi:hypothetical protein